MADTTPPDDAVLQPDTLAALLAGAAADTPDAATLARSRSRLLQRIAAAQPRLLTVAPGDEGFGPFGAGVRIKLLHHDASGASYLLRLEPGASIPAHRHPQDERCVVLEGELQIGDALVVAAGGFHFAPAGSLHAHIGSRDGALIYLQGALPDAQDLI